jgi:hypothetical protein
LYVAYKDNPKAAIYLIYVREIHPVKESEEPRAGKPKGPSDITQHKNLDDRIMAATAIIDLNGNVVFHSHGPTGVQPKKAEKVIRELLGEKEEDSK